MTPAKKIVTDEITEIDLATISVINSDDRLQEKKKELLSITSKRGHTLEVLDYQDMSSENWVRYRWVTDFDEVFAHRRLV